MQRIDEFNLTFPYPPTAKGRPRFNMKTGTTYTPHETKLFEAHIKRYASLHWKRVPLAGPVRLRLIFNFTKPKSKKPDEMHFVSKKIDLDNCVKAITDAINGVIYVDDVQIMQIWAEKKYAERESIEMWISEIVPDTKG
jgi:Holliday junction resolvase RusA-like endonuclease